MTQHGSQAELRVKYSRVALMVRVSSVKERAKGKGAADVVGVDDSMSTFSLGESRRQCRWW